jgi:Domain of unknown function (DUF1961)
MPPTLIRYAPGGEQPAVEGAVTLMEHAGRPAWRAASVRDRLCFPRHTLNAPRGTLGLRILPLEDFATCVQIPHSQEKEPGAWNTVLLSDNRDLHTRLPGWPAAPVGSFALVYSRDWYHQLYAKFYPGNIYMDAYTPGREKAIVTLGHLSLPRRRWIQITLTWDREAGDYRLYVEGILAARSSVFGQMGNEPCGPSLYAGDPAIAVGEVVFSDEATPPQAPGPQPDSFVQALLAQHAPAALPAFSPPRDAAGWTTLCSRSLARDDDRKLFHVQGMQDVLRTVPDGLEVRTSPVHPQLLPRPDDWPAHEPFDIGQTYLWVDCPCEGDLWLEFDFMPLQRHGLALLMLQAQGMHREDFMLDHPRRRTGSMRMVCWENVRNYHWEYYRQMGDCRHDTASHVLVKNPVLRPLAYQVMPERIAVGQWHRLVFLQEGGRLRGSIDGKRVIDAVDSPLAGFGPVYDHGRIGFRCMFDTWMRMKDLIVRTRSPAS